MQFTKVASFAKEKEEKKMTTKFPCYIEFTNLGTYARLVHKSGYIIAEFLIDSPNLLNRAAAAHDRLGLQMIPRPENHFIGNITTIFDISSIEEEIEILHEMLTDAEGAVAPSSALTEEEQEARWDIRQDPRREKPLYIDPSDELSK